MEVEVVEVEEDEEEEEEVVVEEVEVEEEEVEEEEVEVEEDRRSKKAGCDMAVLHRRTPHRWIDGPCLSLTSELPNKRCDLKL